QGTVRLVRQALKRVGLNETLALGGDGLGGCLWSSTGWTPPEGEGHDAQQQQDEDQQLIADKVWTHPTPPFDGGVWGPFYPVCRPQELSAAIRYTTRCPPSRGHFRPR